MKFHSSWFCVFCWGFVGWTKSQSDAPPLATDCLAGTQFQLFLVEKTFEQAKEECESISARLARISNKQDHDIVVGLLFRSNPERGDAFWIGNRASSYSANVQSSVLQVWRTQTLAQIPLIHSLVSQTGSRLSMEVKRG